MKRNRPVRRLAAALLNLLFLLAWGEPAMLPPCPTHDGVMAAATHAMHSAAATPATAAAAHAAVAQHAMMPAAAGHESAPMAEHACRCIGQCSPTAAIVLPTVQAVRWQVVVRRLVEPAPAPPVAPIAAAPRLLPFANGPPRAA